LAAILFLTAKKKLKQFGSTKTIVVVNEGSKIHAARGKPTRNVSRGIKRNAGKKIQATKNISSSKKDGQEKSTLNSFSRSAKCHPCNQIV
jgi:hypothetical protein